MLKAKAIQVQVHLNKIHEVLSKTLCLVHKIKAMNDPNRELNLKCLFTVSRFPDKADFDLSSSSNKVVFVNQAI